MQSTSVSFFQISTMASPFDEYGTNALQQQITRMRRAGFCTFTV